jgi:hypothetical protein
MRSQRLNYSCCDPFAGDSSFPMYTGSQTILPGTYRESGLLQAIPTERPGLHNRGFPGAIVRGA